MLRSKERGRKDTDDGFERPGHFIQWAPDRVLAGSASSSPTLPALPSSWEAYFDTTSCPYTSNPSILRTMLTISLYMPLTILNALHSFKIVPGPRMVVHVLGARMDFEMQYGGMAFEELMHQLPWVQELVLELIGPAVGTDDSTIPMDCCPKCTRAGRKRTYKVANALYHDYLPRARTIPDLVVAFNSGLHESPDSWKPTVDLIMARKFPAVFTSYNVSEAARDAEQVGRMGARVLWSEKNPWSGEKAHMDYFSEDLFWFENGYWMGFQGKQVES
ncbi:hypothetical protein HWV62_11265 [Athelia sp. TMB]|nr:hypothetical protein HWV62_11265 [Athelia sp. TMB]